MAFIHNEYDLQSSEDDYKSYEGGSFARLSLSERPLEYDLHEYHGEQVACSHCGMNGVSNNRCPRCNVYICEHCHRMYHDIFGEVKTQGYDESNNQIYRTDYEQTMEGIRRYSNMDIMSDADLRVWHVLQDNYNSFILPLIEHCQLAQERARLRCA